MFKKIEIWILYLTILLSILFAVGFGVLAWPARERLGGANLAVVGSLMLAIQCMWWDAIYWVLNFGF